MHVLKSESVIIALFVTLAGVPRENGLGLAAKEDSSSATVAAAAAVAARKKMRRPGSMGNAPTPQKVDQRTLLSSSSDGGASSSSSSSLTMYEASGGVHPYQTCDEASVPCDLYIHYRHFCSYLQDGKELIHAYGPDWRDPTEVGIWTPCPNSNSECHNLPNQTQKAVESCLDLCPDLVELGGKCDGINRCGPNTGLFCNFQFEEEEEGSGSGGLCEACPTGGPSECLSSGIKSELGIESCLSCELGCEHYTFGEMTVDGQNHMVYAWTGPNLPLVGSVIGPLVDCSDLVKDGVTICPGVEGGGVCLVEDTSKEAWHYELANWCEDSGGVALVLIVDNRDSGLDNENSNLPAAGYLTSPVGIPVVNMAYNEGIVIRKEKIGSLTNVTIIDTGYDSCWESQVCSKTIPCMGYYEDGFCIFNDDGDEGIWCDVCPEDPTECYFPSRKEPRNQNTVKACASKCAADVQFGSNCKFCGEALTPDFEFGVDDPSDKCYFCPEQDILYPYATVPLFSSEQREIECWQVQGFFDRVDIPKDSKNCKLAQAQNYICGCQGIGYAGASTQTKQRALVWGPRITALLSLFGSIYVLYDSWRENKRRNDVFYQLMIQLSVFDIVGSIAYSLTSLPIPSEYSYYGAHGNEGTCIAQGFFIQIGTISCYTSVSLAIYFYLRITKGASEIEVKKLRLWLFLLPIIVGMSFAFAGIAHYDNMLLWCNNAAPWWPDIPVAIAIAVATFVMGIICWDVYQNEKVSLRWRGSEAGNPLSKRVFWQSFWFLMVFYATWPPYLALQYAWASGSAYSHYGFILFAGLVVPMQGFWNFFVYSRTRCLKGVLKRARKSLGSSLRYFTNTRRSTIEQGQTSKISSTEGNSSRQEDRRRSSTEKEETRKQYGTEQEGSP